MPNELSQDLESELSSSKTQILDSKKNLDRCESKLNEQTESEKDECAGIIQSATKSGATKSGGIPQYGPTRGDKCLRSGDDETGKYTLQFSSESEHFIQSECDESPGNCALASVDINSFQQAMKEIRQKFYFRLRYYCKIHEIRIIGLTRCY